MKELKSAEDILRYNTTDAKVDYEYGDTILTIDLNDAIRCMQEYAKQYIDAQLEVAAEEAILYSNHNFYSGHNSTSCEFNECIVDIEVDTESIRNCTRIELK